jgi:hypothetical protein
MHWVDIAEQAYSIANFSFLPKQQTPLLCMIIHERSCSFEGVSEDGRT